MAAAKKLSRSTFKFVILLPPSEGKAEHGKARSAWRSNSGEFGEHLSGARDQVIAALKRVGGGNPQILGVKGPLLERARSTNKNLLGAVTLPAFERYTGVVWQHLNLESMTSTQRSKALKHLVVFSGLLGAVVGADPVPDYRLKMGARISPMGTLSRWWREPLSAVLNQKYAGHIVIDLLPKEHRAAFEPNPDLLGEYLRVEINEKSGRAGGHDAKAAKGRLARHILDRCSDGSTPRAALESFRDPRFTIALESI